MAESIVPTESLNWFKAKGIQPGFDYRDVWRAEHNNAFTIAKMLNADLLTDVKQMVADALAQGQTFEQFRDQLKPLLVKKGWWGVQQMNDPLTQEKNVVQLGSEQRIRTIYKTNMRTARAAGQWDRIQRTKRAMPYLIYEIGPAHEHRVDHVRWNGTLLPVDDPWWHTHMPPNGWGCHCGVRQVSKREYAQLASLTGAKTTAPNDGTRRWINKRTGEIETIPVGIDPGWDYNPGTTREADLQAQLKAKEARMRQS